MAKFADDTTLVDLITENNKMEVDLLTKLCKGNNLMLTVSKTKEIVTEFWRGHIHQPPLINNSAAVEK